MIYFYPYLGTTPDMPPAEMTSAADLATLIAATIALPNTASVAELLVNCAYENLM